MVKHILSLTSNNSQIMATPNKNPEESVEDYNLSLEEAANVLGKSKRTVHRYIERGKLSKHYITTDHGKEIRLKREEVLNLALKLKEKDSDLSDSEPFDSNDPLNLNIREVLSRYERTLYQLGEMAEKLKTKKDHFREKRMELEEERDRLKVQLLNKKSELHTLREEIDRPLTLKERLFGRRNLGN